LANIRGFQFPLPPLSEQKTIVAELEVEQELIDANKKIIEIFENKIRQKIQKIWERE
jgi:type I restriction enzyme M protein